MLRLAGEPQGNSGSGRSHRHRQRRKAVSELILRYSRGVTTVQEELHALLNRIPEDKAEYALNLLRHMLHAPPESDETPISGQNDPMTGLMRRHWKQVSDRIGVDVDQMPKNGSMSGGVVEGRVELIKDWDSEDARHRLSKLDLQGHEIIIQERMAANDSGLRYEVQIFTEASEVRAALNVPLR